MISTIYNIFQIIYYKEYSVLYIVYNISYIPYAVYYILFTIRQGFKNYSHDQKVHSSFLSLSCQILFFTSQILLRSSKLVRSTVASDNKRQALVMKSMSSITAYWTPSIWSIFYTIIQVFRILRYLMKSFRSLIFYVWRHIQEFSIHKVTYVMKSPYIVSFNQNSSVKPIMNRKQ